MQVHIYILIFFALLPEIVSSWDYALFIIISQQWTFQYGIKWKYFQNWIYFVVVQRTELLLEDKIENKIEFDLLKGKTL